MRAQGSWTCVAGCLDLIAHREPSFNFFMTLGIGRMSRGGKMCWSTTVSGDKDGVSPVCVCIYEEKEREGGCRRTLNTASVE
jgi:hypothetical protein